MTIFYQQTLQEGIALAVREAKAVVCFVRDDAELSKTWEEEYFADHDITQALQEKAVSLRLSSGSQEAAFLTSFCPIPKFPTVVVIKNGTLQEFIAPDISKTDFLERLKTALEGKYAPPAPQQPPASAAGNNGVTTSSSPPAPPPAPSPAQQASQSVPGPSRSTATNNTTGPSAGSGITINRQPVEPSPRKELKTKKPKPKEEKAQQAQTPKASAKPTTAKASKQPKEESKPQPPPVPRGPPKEYRLQVRLFDGSSVRSTFTPKQTIRNEVRAWLDEHMTEDNRPYNLKHILTPLPSRTLSVVEESQTLEELGLGSTATLVMVPVQSFTSAYSAGSSLPVRGISAVYDMATSVASSAAGFVGSFIGYGSSAQPTESEPSRPAPAQNPPRLRPSGPNIRTLHDQRNDERDKQFYNGNQLNFQPRDQDGKDS
ncbi:hypothetical protein N7532_001448 [Penicillium argentinense]|uniref:UBX domain-containing protein 2 n=1 Tax=Penicillium argentinense TaxID=1131581 RepID=A0A9W9G2R7_9EURO|nr:uncharacterized protein N7532_001448 [Penicillium argentinense]KAJ5110913.1 hypothetical protein N7532_001448 [Penicillium argentinense]